MCTAPQRKRAFPSLALRLPVPFHGTTIIYLFLSPTATYSIPSFRVALQFACREIFRTFRNFL